MSLSVVIIAKNAADKIAEAIASAKKVADEIIVLEGGSTDNTVAISQKLGARVVKQKDPNSRDFSQWRNQGMEEAKGNWLLYLDHDERLSPELIEDISRITKEVKPYEIAFAIPRLNIILGKKMKHGGWWPDYQVRLFYKPALKKWEGELHERPRFYGEMGHMPEDAYIIHLKHDNISEMVEKTNVWSETEAKLLYDSGHPLMSWWRFWRIMATELIDRLILKGGILDGTAGVIYSIYQMWSRFLTYAKLWEMQPKHK
ncbi:MAG: glycosyltransferase family 2 protein [bacterium]|nr:glycosyltransferase family 2 protein [bacterium]